MDQGSLLRLTCAVCFSLAQVTLALSFRVYTMEREHSDAAAIRGTECPRRGMPNPLARGIVTEGRDPASRLFRDPRGSVTLAKAFNAVRLACIPKTNTSRL
jgi:hypothetical protein